MENPINAEDDILNTDDHTTEEHTNKDSVKHCKYCGKEIDDDSIFCKHCGRRLNADNKSLIRNVVEMVSGIFTSMVSKERLEKIY